MKKSYILAIVLGIIILGITLGIYLFVSNQNKKIASENIIENKLNEVSEKVTDECIEEWNELQEGTNIIETNSNEEKISPNCLVTLKKYYTKCGHTTNEYIDIPEELVNKTKEELQNKYQDWEIEKYTSTEIVLYREYNGECGEHYVLRENEGKIVIYKINENGVEEFYENTEISVDYLTDTDKIEIKEGIKVNGKEKLNQLIEDFE